LTSHWKEGWGQGKASLSGKREYDFPMRYELTDLRLFLEIARRQF
jgi:hypothetical protein